MMEKNMIIYLENRLNQWAEWYSKNDLKALGYPTNARECRTLTAMNHYSYRSKPLPYNEEAEEIELFVRELAKQKPIIASALRYYYFEPGSLRTKASKLHLSHTQFKHYIDMAHYWLAGRISRKSFVTQIL
jgi:hypothetical protein